jgi:nucleoside-diphosphate-sugar epimerase
MATLVTGAFGCIGAWVCRRLLEAGEKLVALVGEHTITRIIHRTAQLIEKAWLSPKGTITHVEQAIPFPSELADPGYQRDLGPAPRTGLEDGIRKTLNEFAALQKAGRLDARELEPAT